MDLWREKSALVTSMLKTLQKDSHFLTCVLWPNANFQVPSHPFVHIHCVGAGVFAILQACQASSDPRVFAPAVLSAWSALLPASTFFRSLLKYHVSREAILLSNSTPGTSDPSLFLLISPQHLQPAVPAMNSLTLRVRASCAALLGTKEQGPFASWHHVKLRQ